MDPDFPRNGPLSGMILTGIGGALALLLGLAVPAVHPVFAAPIPPALADAFLATVLVMIVHKVESYRQHEWAECPVYLTTVHDAQVRPLGQVLFLAVIGTMVAALVLLAVAFRDPPWPLLVFLPWLGQGLHELHHLGKSLALGRYYPGTGTALLFVLTFDLAFFPAWREALALEAPWLPWVWLGVQPLVVAAFALEHRAWHARWQSWVAGDAGSMAG